MHEILDRTAVRLRDARPDLDDGGRTRRELAHAAHLARHGAWRLARAHGIDGPSDDELREDLDACVEEQRAVWRLRSREGGLADSIERLERALRDS